MVDHLGEIFDAIAVKLSFTMRLVPKIASALAMDQKITLPMPTTPYDPQPYQMPVPSLEPTSLPTPSPISPYAGSGIYNTHEFISLPEVPAPLDDQATTNVPTTCNVRFDNDGTPSLVFKCNRIRILRGDRKRILEQYFSWYGPVLDVCLRRQPEGKHPNEAWVWMRDADAVYAIFNAGTVQQINEASVRLVSMPSDFVPVQRNR